VQQNDEGQINPSHPYTEGKTLCYIRNLYISMFGWFCKVLIVAVLT